MKDIKKEYCEKCINFDLRGSSHGMCLNPKSKYYKEFLFSESISCKFIERRPHGRKI
jgi:hypothetical protein